MATASARSNQNKLMLHTENNSQTHGRDRTLITKHFKYLEVVSVAMLAISTTPAKAQTKIGNATTMVLNGSCDKLTIGRQKLGDGCGGKLMNSSYPDGRVGFYFILDDGRTITFSGMDGANPTPDTDVVDLDKVIIGIKGKPSKPKVVAASGTCKYGNPYAGQSTVTCNGKMVDGQTFSANFTSDGSPPN
jgi:hypothetical protein